MNKTNIVFLKKSSTPAITWVGIGWIRKRSLNGSHVWHRGSKLVVMGHMKLHVDITVRYPNQSLALLVNIPMIPMRHTTYRTSCTS